MATRDARTVHVQIVIAFTLWGSGVTGDACPLDSVGENPCFDTLIPVKTEPTNIRYVSSGSCDFRRGMCSYTQACQQNDSNISEWRRNSSQNDWFVETEFSGGNGSDAKSMTLESPPLYIRVPSCLTFTASATKSSKLTVVLRDVNRNWTLCTKEITSGYIEETFHLSLPSSITQVTCQGIGRGIDGPYVVRLYSVAIEPGCCVYKDWLLPLQNSSLSPNCTWNAVNWTTYQKIGQAIVQHGDSENRLTSPVISPPAYNDGRGSGGCFSFSFFLQATEAVSLTVSIIPSSSAGAGQASVTPTWRMDSGSDMDGNRSDKPRDLEMFPGQMPVFLNGFLSRLFRVQFSVESNDTVVVIVRNVSYERDNTIPCPFIPPQARVPGFDADNTAAAAAAAVVAAIAGGTCAAAVFVIVLSLCLWRKHSCWRKRRRRENKSDKSSQAVTMRDIIQPEEDRPDSFNAYTEISLRGSVIPITHDTGPVSATAATSANDVTSQALNRVQLEITDRSNPGTSNFASAGGASCSENGMLTKLDSAEETVHIIKRKHDDHDRTADAGASCPQKYVNDSANTHSEQKHGNCSQRSLARDIHSNDEFANAGTQATQMTDSETSEKQLYHVLENAPEDSTAAAHKPKLTEELYNRLGEKPKTSSVLYDRVGKKNEQSLAACNRLAENAEAESTVYNRLGEVKGGSPTKAREKTAQAYDHVGPLNETVYDVSQRDMQHRVIDGVYDHLSATFPHEST